MNTASAEIGLVLTVACVPLVFGLIPSNQEQEIRVHLKPQDVEPKQCSCACEANPVASADPVSPVEEDQDPSALPRLVLATPEELKRARHRRHNYVLGLGKRGELPEWDPKSLPEKESQLVLVGKKWDREEGNEGLSEEMEDANKYVFGMGKRNFQNYNLRIRKRAEGEGESDDSNEDQDGNPNDYVFGMGKRGPPMVSPYYRYIIEKKEGGKEKKWEKEKQDFGSNYVFGLGKRALPSVSTYYNRVMKKSESNHKDLEDEEDYDDGYVFGMGKRSSHSDHHEPAAKERDETPDDDAEMEEEDFGKHVYGMGKRPLPLASPFLFPITSELEAKEEKVPNVTDDQTETEDNDDEGYVFGLGKRDSSHPLIRRARSYEMGSKEGKSAQGYVRLLRKRSYPYVSPYWSQILMRARKPQRKTAQEKAVTRIVPRMGKRDEGAKERRDVMHHDFVFRLGKRGAPLVTPFWRRSMKKDDDESGEDDEKEFEDEEEEGGDEYYDEDGQYNLSAKNPGVLGFVLRLGRK